MEEIRFSDWPDPPGNGAWLPAYGYQQQNDLSDKEDYLNPNEVALLAGSATSAISHHTLYLETIMEETSDDLRSENSSLSHGQGWFSDSDADSVIHVAGRDIEECDSGSERDFMCPPKRRRRNVIQTDCPPFSNPPMVEPFHPFKTTVTCEPFQYRNVPDCLLTDSTSDDNDSLSLSRSSSLVQFENIEKSCLTIDPLREGSSPSIYSQLSFDSLEKTPSRVNSNQVDSPKMSPDSLDGSYSSEPRSISSQEDKYSLEIAAFCAKIDGLTKLNDIDDELNSDGHEWKDDDDNSDGSSQGFAGDSSDSERTVDEKRGERKYNFKSCRSLDALPSFESLDAVKDDSSVRTKRRSPRRAGNQFSAENLSEDSGYSDHLCFMRTKSKSNPNVNERKAEDCNFVALAARHRRDEGSERCTARASTPEIELERGGTAAAASRCRALPRSAASVPCLVPARPLPAPPPQKLRAASVPADLDLCADTPETPHEPCAERPSYKNHTFVQTFRVHESFTTSVADLTALDYRTHSKRMTMTSRQDARLGVRIPLRESSAESDSTTESEKAFLKEVERSLRSLDEKTADMLEQESPKCTKPTVLLNDKRMNHHSATPFDAVIAELRGKHRMESPSRYEFDFYGDDPDPPDYARRRDVSGSTTERSSPDLDRFTNSDLFFASTPVKESDKVRSAPNLNALTTRRYQAEEQPLGILSGRSQGLTGSGSSGARGVHFCPVVAEVSWREVSCSEDSELGGGSSADTPTDSEQCSRDESPMETSNTNSVGVSTWSAPERDRQTPKAEGPSETAEAAPRKGAAASVRGRTETAQHAMQEAKPRSRIGGFLSRFANFRFSSRKDNKKQPKSSSVAAAKADAKNDVAKSDSPDYVYIPLKVPQNGGALAGKPPLPPPRALGPEMTPPGVLETDLDTATTVVLATAPHVQQPNKARSLLALAGDQAQDRRPHKSMEYLLDKENIRVVEPPENDLQKNSDRVLSEHELRVQRSLQKLNVPDWYKNAPAPREGFLLRKRLSDAASSPSSTRWPGLNGKTTSLGSLAGVTAPVLPPQLSPANTSFGRWSTSRLNSNQTSPCSSTRSSVRGTASPLCSPSTRSSFSSRTPYLGWRSQERLSGRPRTPHERLAISLLPQNSASSKASEEIQTSIKEVTSAIVHYVSGLEPGNSEDNRAPSPRSNQKFCWVESSFVGTKPLECPQTPLVSTQASLPPIHPRPPSSLRLEFHHRQGQATGESPTSKLV